MNKQGKIGVTSENIFPVIKKFLYSEHDIFLRELVSNAVDATTKLNALVARGEKVGDTENLKVEIEIDEKEHLLIVRDFGIGMTMEEVDKYINQIAFSGAEDFLEKYKDTAASIIGHFGLGFYSAFMVAEKVEIRTRSYQENAQAVKWVCDGSPNYTMEYTEKENRGTEIILHIDEESREFLKKETITTLLEKYCRFLPVPIHFGKKQEWKDGKMQDTEEDLVINEIQPLWLRKPVDLTDEDYKSFYRMLYPMSDEPLFWIHLNVDFPFTLTGVLYFPKVHSSVDLQKNKIKLFCNQVYVTDEVEGIVPEYLTLLHGVIDSPDIPLNVSRSYLQGDPNVSKISNHITKKVADKLEELYKNDRKSLEEKWADLKIFVLYGMLTDEKFAERAMKFVLLTDVDKKNYTLDEYKTLISSSQTDKDNNQIILYASDVQGQYSYIKAAQDKGYNVLLWNGQLDLPFVNFLEQKWENCRFVRVDSDSIDRLIAKEDASQEVDPDTSSMVSSLFEGTLPNNKDRVFHIQTQHLGAEKEVALVTRDEWMRRMKDMSHLQSGMGFYGSFPDSFNIVLNVDSPLIADLLEKEKAELEPQLTEVRKTLSILREELSILESSVEKEQDNETLKTDRDNKRKEVEDQEALLKSSLHEYGNKQEKTKQIVDLALLSAGLLQGESLDAFVKRSYSLLA